jgi:uncharacterized repeat protein (TIGR03803 family)
MGCRWASDLLAASWPFRRTIPARRAIPVQLRIEPLETRCVPSITTLASFPNPSNGQDPDAGLIEDSKGNLFGSTAQGGAYGAGTVFEMPAGTGTVISLASFNGANGVNPDGKLVEDSSGDLFGVTFMAATSMVTAPYSSCLIAAHKATAPFRPSWPSMAPTAPTLSAGS